MKKSKIIVPALGLLLLSTAASVSGTVAWFTANRTYNISVSSFGVGTAEGNLSGVTVTGVVGCMADGNTVSFKTHPSSSDITSILADGSFNEAVSGTYAKHLFIDDGSVTASDGTNRTAFLDLGTADEEGWKAGTKEGNNYYYAISWTAQLRYTFGAETDDVDLFVDLSNAATATKFAVAQNGEGTHQVEKGLRIAIYTGTNKPVVLAPFRTSSEGTSNTLGRAQAPGNPGTFTQYNPGTANDHVNYGQSDTYGNANYGKFNLTKASDKAANPDTRMDYVGYFDQSTKNASSQVDLTVTVVVWLEGTDPATVSASNLADTISGNINFYCANHDGAY